MYYQIIATHIYFPKIEITIDSAKSPTEADIKLDSKKNEYGENWNVYVKRTFENKRFK